MYQQEIKDRLVVMRAQEDNGYVCSDYLQTRPHSQPSSPKSSTKPSSGPIDKICRSKMTQWCYTVIDYIKFERETVNIAMNYLDRFLASQCPRAIQVMNSRKEYQLAAMTTLFMAIKVHEPVMIDTELLTDLSKGLYTPSDFQSMETDILFGLNWRVNGPTAQSFLMHLLPLVQSYDRENMGDLDLQNVLQLATHQVELSVQEYEFMTQKPSVIATASIVNVMQSSSQEMQSALFVTSLLQLVSNLGVSIDSVLAMKESLSKRCKVKSSTMKMRPNMSTMMEVQVQPQPPQPSPLESMTVISKLPSTSPISPTARTVSPHSISSSNKGFSHYDGSPICVTERNVVVLQRQ